MDDLKVKQLLKENPRYAGVAQPFHFDATRNDAEAFNLETFDASYQAIKDDARLNAARVQLLAKALLAALPSLKADAHASHLTDGFTRKPETEQDKIYMQAVNALIEAGMEG